MNDFARITFHLEAARRLSDRRKIEFLVFLIDLALAEVMNNRRILSEDSPGST